MRVGYLDLLVPGAYFIHIVRDGMAVIDSIEKLTHENSYKVALRKNNNAWWGVGFCKWEYLKRDGKQHHYFADEVDALTDTRQMAAYEWFLSLAEVEKRRGQLGDRLVEITYDDLVAEPKKTLNKIADRCGLGKNNEWPGKVLYLMGKNNNADVAVKKELILPPKMCEAFNVMQKKYGFTSFARAQNL
jgi:hypothetical protein